MKTPVVVPCIPIEELAGDIFICCLGYESRSIFVAQKLALKFKKRVAIQFSDRNVLAFSSNKRILEQLDFSIHRNEVESLELALSKLISNAESGRTMKLLIDISSMTRVLLANLVHFLSQICEVETSIEFVYAPSAYIAPLKMEPPQTYSGPVTPDFAGWTLDPREPISAILGTGYEFGRALGIMEFIEPTETWVFNPTGFDVKFDEALTATNEGLRSIVPETQQIEYDVKDPFSTFVALESLVYGLSSSHRVLLCPFGPKIFALICLLVAVSHYPKITVWRVSGGASEEPIDHHAAGEIIQLGVHFS